MDEVLVGVVVKPHGVKGELKIYPQTHDPMRFKRLREVVLTDGAAKYRFAVKRASVQPGFVYLALDGIESMDEGEKYRGWEVRIDRSEVPPLQEGWYYFELEGLQVYERERFLGTLTKVLETGANDVYLVNGPLGEICVPALKRVVKKVDVPGRRMEVELPPGLMDDES
ncbi:ribosome maturation factor RimM [Paradesulfitobacterium ferrireducens]|uniref:ribosome maturation factor RimM n=1 Tax=Paradesulfitobacterium ferrireducens TaxID=2816476 RepID=UPI001A8E5B72|nr:ribosome maturation factor RimM [Paradesulfitobacterium ferrireducens]